jgi:hypothetical protein
MNRGDDSSKANHSDPAQALRTLKDVESDLRAFPVVRIPYAPPRGGRRRVAYLLGVLVAIQAAKFVALSRDLRRCILAADLFLYGRLGRSLIEDAAMLRYYLWATVKPLSDDAL